MDKSNRFSLLMEALTEVAQEEQSRAQNRPSAAASAPLSLKSVLAEVSPLPPEAAFLGVAEDGLPVLLSLHDPAPGPILIVGDAGSGKTNLLQIIARAADLLHASATVQYVVITARVEEWAAFPSGPNKAGMYRAGSEDAGELLRALATWAHNNKGGLQSVLLFIDGLDTLLDFDDQTQQDLRWLLLRGPSRRVWPLVTLNTNRAMAFSAWMPFFRTRLFGRIQNPHQALFVTGKAENTLHHLAAGAQFAMREGNALINFWAPPLD